MLASENVLEQETNNLATHKDVKQEDILCCLFI